MSHSLFRKFGLSQLFSGRNPEPKGRLPRRKHGACRPLFIEPLEQRRLLTASNLDQWANGPLGDTDPANDMWQNGNLNENQAHYAEAEVVPYRTQPTDMVAGETYWQTIAWDTGIVSSGIEQQDFTLRPDFGQKLTLGAVKPAIGQRTELQVTTQTSSGTT